MIDGVHTGAEVTPPRNLSADGCAGLTEQLAPRPAAQAEIEELGGKAGLTEQSAPRPAAHAEIEELSGSAGPTEQSALRPAAHAEGALGLASRQVCDYARKGCLEVLAMG